MTSERTPRMNLSVIADWLKIAVVAIPFVIGAVGGSIKFFERFSAVPELQKDVKRLKRDMRFVVRTVAKQAKVEPPRREVDDEE